ncbi:MAG: hypothetical protein QXT77_10180 [Candidatus Methanomethylicaceae archaeon]
MAERKIVDSARIRWVFTLHLSEEEPYEDNCHLEFHEVTHILSEAADVKAIVMQLEIAPETKRPHIQGGLWLHKRKKMGGVKSIFGERYKSVHLEPAMGNPEQVFAYNTKEESRMPGTEPFIKDWPRDHKGQGTRSDLKEAVDLLKNGKSLSHVS